ncbi:MAG: Gfo/Idh/MocA family oxidoreductase [Terracidiphilus sp.]|nr:Gfo/Idh/MocA family oxidoreductase [Terracidiphilus sp.]MDR3776608.1 Gfo/Idh/MocA family oxidoreductase [Terracidiphilus sp.]
MTLTRRDFAKLGMLGLAARFAPALNAQAPARKTGYCVIGLGRIASHFMPGVLNTTNSRITALVSAHREKAERIAIQYGVPQSSIYNYDNFDEIARNPAIDAVYVALPNSMHAEYTLRAAKAGKHVLCEKPMSTNVAEAERMIAACKAANVKLMIAYRCHYEPTNLKAIKLIRDGALGQVQAIESAFGFNIGKGEWRIDKKLAGGGPLFDVGIYSLNACRYLTGEEPHHIAAFASTIDRDGRFNEVEENVAWTMKFPSGILASCSTTYGAGMEGFYRVHGSKGWLEVDQAFSYSGLRLRAEFSGTKLDELNPARDPSHFQAEAEHFSHCIQNGLEAKSPGEEGLRDMRYITEIYRSAGISI